MLKGSTPKISQISLNSFLQLKERKAGEREKEANILFASLSKTYWVFPGPSSFREPSLTKSSTKKSIKTCVMLFTENDFHPRPWILKSINPCLVFSF